MGKRIQWALATLCVLAILGSVGVIVAKAHHNGGVMFGMVTADGFAEKPISPWDVAKYGDAKKPYPVARRAWYSIRRLIPRSEKQKEAKVKPMASYTATGAGDTTYNGTYTESGTQGGQPAYTNGSRWLWFDTANWKLTPTKGGVALNYYESYDTDLVGTWIAVAHEEPDNSPAPTVAEYTPATPGVSNPYQWPYANYWGSPVASGGSTIAPCRATIGGVDSVLLAFDDGGDNHGILQFDLTEHTWLRHDASALLWPADERGTGAGLYDAGDGTHVWAYSGPFGTTTPAAHFSKFALAGGVATQVSTVEVAMPSTYCTNLLPVGADLRFVARDDGSRFGGNMLYCSYTLGDAAYSTVKTNAAFDTEEPMRYEYVDGEHRGILVQTPEGEVVYLREQISPSQLFVPYGLNSNGYTRWIGETLSSTVGNLDATLISAGTYDHPAGEIVFELTRVNQFPSVGVYHEAYGWQPHGEVQTRESFTPTPAGLAWLISGSDYLLSAGWGAGAAAGCPFALYAAPVEVALGHTTNANTSHALSFAYTLPLGHTASSNVSHAFALNEVQAMPLGHTVSAARSHPLTLVASTVRTPAACTIDVYEVRVRALPA